MTAQNKKYCPRIYHGLTLSNISNTEISYSVCCWGDPVKYTSIDFYNKNFSQLRNVNQEGQLPLPYCRKCYAQEQTDKKSMRLGYLETHGDESSEPSLQYLDINIDYTCNLACVTCGPDLSTTWRNELKIKSTNVRPHIDNFIKEQLTTLDFSQLKEVRLWGGEPFLTNTHKDILQYIINQGYAHKIKLMYNTNGTQLIDNKTKKLIEQFKFARISFSIDAIGEKFNYIRYPANWLQVEQNLIWWKHNLPHNSMLSLTVTASILNVLDLNEVTEWCRLNFDQSVFGDSIEIYVHQAFGTYGLEFMSSNMVDYLKSLPNYSQQWIQQLPILGQQNFNLNHVLDALRIIDVRRNLNFAQVSPVTARLLGYQK
jgi:hypothetical protein